MKVAALSFYSATDAFSAGRSRTPNFSGEPLSNQGERRRKPRVAEAIRLSATPRLTTGLAVQVIAQLERVNARHDEQVQAARTAYQPNVDACGAVVNLKA